MTRRHKVAIVSPSGTAISVFAGILYDVMIARSADSSFRFFTPPSCQKVLGDCHFGLMSGYPPAPIQSMVNITFQGSERGFFGPRDSTFEVLLVPIDMSLQDTIRVYEENCRLVLLVLDANSPDPSGSDRSIRQLLGDMPNTSRLEVVILDLGKDGDVRPSLFSPDLDRWDLKPYHIRIKSEKDRAGNLRPLISEEIGKEITYTKDAEDILDLLLSLGNIDNRRRIS